NDARAHRENVACELGAHHGGDHTGHAFDGLEHHVAHEAVAYDDVDGALADVVAFDVAVEVQPAVAQQFGRLLHDLVALDDFFADIEQANGGLAALVECRNERGAHDGELQKVVGRAVDVGAQVEHRGGTALDVGDRGGNGRTVDAVEGFEHVARHGHERAGVAR